MIKGYNGCAKIKSLAFTKSDIVFTPVIVINRIKAASRKKPPNPVMAKAVNALLRDSWLSLLKPIRKKDDILVSSQKINKSRMLSDKTTPSIADMKSNKYPKKRSK